jgi:hypothetical protein
VRDARGWGSLTRDEHRYIEAPETLLMLTRTAFLLASHDHFSYAEIAWRCGISVNEVQVRVSDALLCLQQHMSSGPTLAGYIRPTLRLTRSAWAAARTRESDRRLAPWLSPGKEPGKRNAIDWVAWAFDAMMR